VKLEKDYLREVPKVCGNCKGLGAGFRKEGTKLLTLGMKVFSKAVSKSVRIKMEGQGLHPKTLFADEGEDDFSKTKKEIGDTFVTPNLIAEHLRLLYTNEFAILDLFYGSGKNRKCDIGLFTMHVMTVTPSKFRPSSKMGDKIFEHPQVFIFYNPRMCIWSMLSKLILKFRT
jgi:DNA-directed RNA polymerase I subunit RPA1